MRCLFAIVFLFLNLSIIQAQEGIAFIKEKNPYASRIHMLGDIWQRNHNVPIIKNHSTSNDSFNHNKSVLLNKDWTQLVVYPKIGAPVNLDLANYDVKNDAFIVKAKDGDTFIFDNDKISSAEFNSMTFRKFKDEKGISSYYIVLYDGHNIGFLKRHKVNLIKPSLNPLSHAKVSQDKYIKKEEYYVYKSNKLISIKLNKKQLLKVFSDDKVELENLAKEHQLSFTNEKDVITLISKYNIKGRGVRL